MLLSLQQMPLPWFCGQGISPARFYSFNHLFTYCLFLFPPNMALVLGLFQASEKIHVFLHFPPFCLDRFTNSPTLLRFSVNLTCFMSFRISSLLWSSDDTFLSFLALIQIYLYCSLSPVLLIGFENRGGCVCVCVCVCVFSVTSEIILVFQICSYFKRNLIFFLALMRYY